MHTLDVVFKQRSPPPLPQAQKHKNKHTATHRVVISHAKLSVFSCAWKNLSLCLYWTSTLWCDRQIRVQNRDRGRKKILTKQKNNYFQNESGCGGTVEHVSVRQGIQIRVRNSQSERSGQGPKLCIKQWIHFSRWLNLQFKPHFFHPHTTGYVFFSPHKIIH